MTTLPALHTTFSPELHVFEQDGGWHWGITIPRAVGSGFKLIAFSERMYGREDAARHEGQQALDHLARARSQELAHQ